MRIIVLSILVFFCCAIDSGSSAAHSRNSKVPVDFLKDPPNFTEAPLPKSPPKGKTHVPLLFPAIHFSLPQIPMIFPRINRQGNQDYLLNTIPALALSNAFLRFSVQRIFKWLKGVNHSRANCPMDRVMAFVARPVIIILVSVYCPLLPNRN